MKEKRISLVILIFIVLSIFTSYAFAESYGSNSGEKRNSGNMEMSFDELLERISEISERDAGFVEQEIFLQEGGAVQAEKKYKQKNFVQISTVVKKGFSDGEILGSLTVYGEGQAFGQDHIRLDSVLYAYFEPNEAICEEEKFGFYGEMFLCFENGNKVYYSLEGDFVTAEDMIQLNLGNAYYLLADMYSSKPIRAQSDSGQKLLRSLSTVFAAGRFDGNI